MKILIVDDDPEMLELWAKVCKELGECVTTTRPAEAVRMFMLAEHFDIVLTDYTMPIVSGLTMALHIRNFNQHVPIICLTGDKDTAERNNKRDGSPLALILEKGSFRMDRLREAILELTQQKAKGAHA